MWLSIIIHCREVCDFPYNTYARGPYLMHELRAMWRNTRMIVLCAISAALYAAVLVPFKVVPLIPGVTELRPANAIPVVCSFLFGPAAAWGSAIGNMIGDFFGGVSPGDSFGFIGNLAYGYIPYKIWSVVAVRHSPVEGSWPRGARTSSPASSRACYARTSSASATTCSRSVCSICLETLSSSTT